MMNKTIKSLQNTLIATLLLTLPISTLAAGSIALEGPWQVVLDWIVSMLTGKTGAAIATIAVISAGFLLFKGAISLLQFGLVLLGIAIVFGSSGIVDGIQQALN